MSNLPHPVVHAAQYEDIDPQKKEKTGMVSEDDSMQLFLYNGTHGDVRCWVGRWPTCDISMFSTGSSSPTVVSFFFWRCCQWHRLRLPLSSE